jgi:Flp pilus assembly protein TadG
MSAITTWKPFMRGLSIFAARLRGFAKSTSGVAAVEFAYIAPLLMLMTFGTFEVTRALIVHKRFQRATAMVGDLVARESKLWPADEDEASVTTSDAKATLNGILQSVEHTMEPYSSSPLQITVYQLWASMSDAKKTKIEWSYQYPAGTTSGCGDPKAMPETGMLQPGGRAIVVEAKYKYTPLLSNLLPGFVQQMNWSDTMTFAPRNVPTIEFLPGLNNDKTWDNPSKAACS